MKAKNTAKVKQKHDPLEVPWLLVVAKEQDKTTIPEKYQWIAELQPLEARNILLTRFQILVSTLVNVCITGRPNTWSSYAMTFISLFKGRATSAQATAAMLKRELADYDNKELFHVGQLAVLEAIKITHNNLASTIVTCFKDLIYSMIKEGVKPTNIIDVPDLEDSTKLDDEIAIKIFLESLTPDELTLAQSIIHGEYKGQEIPESLKHKFETYLTIPLVF